MGSVLIYLTSRGSGDANLIVSELRPPSSTERVGPNAE